jgi:hypothetical protein
MLFFPLIPWILFNIFTSSPLLVRAEGRAVRSHDLNRVARRTIMCMLLIVALALVGFC